MNIAFVIHEMTAGGAERVVSVLANYMVKTGMSVTIFMTAGNRVEYNLDRRVIVTQVGRKISGNPFLLLDRLCNLRKALKNGEFEAVIAFEADTGLYTVLANALLNNNIFISERSNPEKYRKPLLRDFAYRRAKRVIFQTESARCYFRGKIRKNGVVVGNPLLSDLPDIWKGERKKKIVSVGRLEIEKNFFLLIDAFTIFSKSHPDYSLHIFGKGTQQVALQKKINELNMCTSCFLEGFHSNVTELISDASMFVMTSDYEGMPNALMEAMAVGLPVISTDCPLGGPRQLINDEVDGLLVSCGDVKAIADAMSRLADDPEFADKLGKEAYRIRDKYNVEAICDQWVTAIS